MSQREVANLLGVHEGSISRQTDKLRDHALDAIGKRLVEDGWTGDDLEGYILAEMGVIGIALHPGRRAAVAALYVLFPLYSLLAVYQIALFYVM